MRRWIAFISVGALGVVIQLVVLVVLSRGLGLNYLVATGLAVEAAVLHNFVGHEAWTWSDRSRGDKAGRWRRLARFHAANGALSMGGNILLMRFFVDAVALNVTPANLLAIALCSILNFLACDRLVFQGAGLRQKIVLASWFNESKSGGQVPGRSLETTTTPWLLVLRMPRAAALVLPVFLRTTEESSGNLPRGKRSLKEYDRVFFGGETKPPSDEAGPSV